MKPEVDQMNRIKSPDIYGQLVFDKGAKNTQKKP